MKAKKSLGQNFLRNQHLAEQIVALADLRTNDFVLEIGPGEGILTDIIIQKMWPAARASGGALGDGLFFAVEKDWMLAEKLKKKYKNRKNIKIICADVLEIADELAESLGENYKLISNLPYNISNLILNRFYFSNNRSPASIPKLAVLMVQREVAERLIANPGEKARGIPTVLLENVAEAKIAINHIKPGAFSPAPAVESSVIKIIRKEKIGELNPVVVKAGFSAKRQKLVNSLSRGLKMPKDKISAIIKEAGINENLRAEDLTLENWQKLSEEIYVFLGGIGK